MKLDFPRLYIFPEIRRKMVDIAREFRKAPTKGEKNLWEALRGRKLDGIKFRRQQPVRYFVVDFYNSVYRMVIEVDGTVHKSPIDADRAKQEILQELGLAVLRINSEVVEMNLPTSLDLFRQAIRNQNKQKDIASLSIGECQGGG